MVTDNSVLECSHCGSKDYTKYGTKNGKQLYMCSMCKRKFFDNMEEVRKRLRMKERAILMHLDNVSYRKISDKLFEKYEFSVSYATIRRWVKKFEGDVERNVWEVDNEIPIFTKNRNYIDKYLEELD